MVGGITTTHMTKTASIAARCRFHTARLSVESWTEALSDADRRAALAERMVEIMTPEVAQALPPKWQPLASFDEALEWLEARAAEGDCFTVKTKDNDCIVGCLVAYAETAESDPALLDLRIGYLFAREAWGHGFASELIAGLVDWCVTAGDIRTLIGGVEEDNVASIRVLEKNGFRLVPDGAEPPMVVMRRVLTGRP